MFSFETATITQDITLIGIDLGKHDFHVHGEDRHVKALLRKEFSRTQLIEFLANSHTRTIVMETCADAHYMARQLAGYGHDVKWISPQFVPLFVKSNKNDFVDGEAICEAAGRPSMRFVTPKLQPSRPFQRCTACANRQTGQLARWVSAMLPRRHSNVVACALANKLPRIAWAIVTGPGFCSQLQS